MKKKVVVTGANSLKAYANTKLFNIMFTYELAGRIRDTGTTAFSIHPGGIRTKLNSGGGGGSLFAFLFKIGKPFLQDPDKGAETLVNLATEPGIEPLSGKYSKINEKRAAVPGSIRQGKMPAVVGFK